MLRVVLRRIDTDQSSFPCKDATVTIILVAVPLYCKQEGDKAGRMQCVRGRRVFCSPEQHIKKE